MSRWRHAIKMTERIKLLCKNTASYPRIFNSVWLWYTTDALTELCDWCTASMLDPKFTFWSESDQPLLCTWHPWMAYTFHRTYQVDSPLVLIQLAGWWWTEPVGLTNKLPLAFICTTVGYKLHIYVASNETMYWKLERVGQVVVVMYSHLSVMYERTQKSFVAFRVAIQQTIQSLLPTTSFKYNPNFWYGASLT